VFGRNTQHDVLRKKGTSLQHQNLISTVKYGGVSILVWGCFAASGLGQLATVLSTEKLIVKFIKTFFRILLGYLSTN
jgi:hypothetical protein